MNRLRPLAGEQLDLLVGDVVAPDTLGCNVADKQAKLGDRNWVSTAAAALACAALRQTR